MEYWISEFIKMVTEILSSVDEDEIEYSYEDEIKFED